MAKRLIQGPAAPVWIVSSDGSIVSFTELEDINARILRMYDDNYQPVKVYPTLAAGATVISGGAAWALGAVAEVMPAATCTTDFLIKNITIETINIAAGTFELVLYSGAADDEIARVRFSIVGGFFGNTVFVMPSALVVANSRIRAALACSAGAATATVSISYRPIIL
jgi:hypothetical protein